MQRNFLVGQMRWHRLYLIINAGRPLLVRIHTQLVILSLNRALVNPQASTNLNASINAANASYNTTQAVTAYVTSGRNENI
jgi:hypothetical protein